MKKINNVTSSIPEVLYRLNVNSKIDEELLENCFDEILSSNDVYARDTQMGSLLTGLMARGPKKEEVATLLKSAFKLDNYSTSKRELIDLPDKTVLIGAIGSGKKGHKTMNISTPALIIAATIGAYTAKPVSSATSSICGSADLMREVGVNIEIPMDEMKDIVKKTRFGVFCIEKFIPKFDSVYSGKFYAPHALSFGLAALATPIKYDNMLYGLAHPNVELSAEVLNEFEIRNVMIVSSTYDNIHYLDEMGVCGITRIIGIRNGKIGKLRHFNPLKELKLPCYSPRDICQGNTVEENVQLCVDVLKGKGEKAREDVVCINSGTLLYLAEMAEDLREGYYLSKNVLETGTPIEKLLEVVDATKGEKKKLYKYLR